MLDVLLEANKISQADYVKTTDTIKQYEVEDDDRPLTEMEKGKLWGRFKDLHLELIHKRQRENIMELNKIFHILLEEKVVAHTVYVKAINAINKNYSAPFCNYM